MSNCNQIHFKVFLLRVRYYKKHHIYNINSTLSVYRRYSEGKIKFSLHLNTNTWIEEKKYVSILGHQKSDWKQERIFKTVCQHIKLQGVEHAELSQRDSEERGFYPCQT